MSRRAAREVAFKVLFQADLVQADPEESLNYLIADMGLSQKDLDFTRSLIMGTLEKRSELDKRIANYSPEWTLERMGAVDRNLLRMAAYEIVFGDDVHPVVAIDEAVELAKKFGDGNSKSFINAILDRIKEENQ
ncbi:MAG: transcription antitermination factor NusB [Candidatus Saccharibacteria bacterium]